MITHPFAPLYSKASKKLILGSFPSVISREQNFYYGNEKNRFWKVFAQIFDEPTPKTIEEKSSLILSHGFALWDVIACCDIKGSLDSSIKNAQANDIKSLIEKTEITRIFINGKKAGALYDKLVYPTSKIEAVVLPSTSPLNAAYSLDNLIKSWKIIKD